MKSGKTYRRCGCGFYCWLLRRSSIFRLGLHRGEGQKAPAKCGEGGSKHNEWISRAQKRVVNNHGMWQSTKKLMSPIRCRYRISYHSSTATSGYSAQSRKTLLEARTAGCVRYHTPQPIIRARFLHGGKSFGAEKSGDGANLVEGFRKTWPSSGGGTP